MLIEEGLKDPLSANTNSRNVLSTDFETSYAAAFTKDFTKRLNLAENVSEHERSYITCSHFVAKFMQREPC